jgi:hypothetical protein
MLDSSTFSLSELTAAIGREEASYVAELIVRNRIDGRYKPKPAVFFIPSGKHVGKRPAQLTTIELKQVWSGYNGCGNNAVADELLKEIRKRERSTR